MAAFFNGEIDVARLGCFNVKTLKIGLPVRSSTTADELNKTSQKTSAEKKEWKKFRDSLKTKTARRNWIKALRELDFFKQNRADLQIELKAEEKVSQTQKAYEDKLREMKEIHGIWNCMEFADFALMKILPKLKSEYTAHIGYLNDPKIPDPSMECAMLKGLDNHDHAFVVITRKENPHEPAFVIDLWQGLIKEQVPFFGSTKQFIAYLNKQPINRFVVGEVDTSHFSIQTDKDVYAACDGAAEGMGLGAGEGYKPPGSGWASPFH